MFIDLFSQSKICIFIKNIFLKKLILKRSCVNSLRIKRRITLRAGFVCEMYSESTGSDLYSSLVTHKCHL